MIIIAALIEDSTKDQKTKAFVCYRNSKNLNAERLHNALHSILWAVCFSVMNCEKIKETKWGKTSAVGPQLGTDLECPTHGLGKQDQFHISCCSCSKHGCHLRFRSQFLIVLQNRFWRKWEFIIWSLLGRFPRLLWKCWLQSGVLQFLSSTCPWALFSYVGLRQGKLVPQWLHCVRWQLFSSFFPPSTTTKADK